MYRVHIDPFTCIAINYPIFTHFQLSIQFSIVLIANSTLIQKSQLLVCGHDDSKVVTEVVPRKSKQVNSPKKLSRCW